MLSLEPSPMQMDARIACHPLQIHESVGCITVGHIQVGNIDLNAIGPAFQDHPERFDHIWPRSDVECAGALQSAWSEREFEFGIDLCDVRPICHVDWHLLAG
jgi:hypothetical protein